jgi:hypothetical protein
MLLRAVAEELGELRTQVDLDAGPRLVSEIALERYDDKTSNSALRQAFGICDHPPNRRRERSLFYARQPFVDYDAAFKFNTLADTRLQKGQVTARGVFLVGSDITP